MTYLAGNPMNFVWLGTEIQAVEGFAKQKKTKIFCFLILCISQSIFASSDSLSLTTSFTFT